MSPEGRRFPVGRWGSELAGVSDGSPDGRRALVRRWGAGAVSPTFTELDLGTGVETAVDAPGTAVDAGYTRPEGANLVLTLQGPDDGYRLVRTDRRGRLLATLADQASSDQPRWLYLPDGTGAVVGAGSGLVVVRNDGTPTRRVDVPRGNCAPVRWWEPGVALASCRGDAAGDNYSQLWRVPVGGGPPVALTPLPAAPEVFDFGITDARVAGGRTILQWQGDCGADALKVLSAGGVVADLPVEGEQEVVLVDAVGGRLAVWGRTGCDGPGLWLGWVDPQGGRREVLVEAAVTPAGEERGIQGVIAFGGGRET